MPRLIGKARAMELVAADRVALEKAEKERGALRAEIVAQSETGEDSLAAYDRISKSKGTAVAEALNQQCTACHVMVRPQRWNDLRDNTAGSTASETLMTCENCGRMLYLET